MYDYIEYINEIDVEFIQALKFDYIFNNQYEDLPEHLNKESEDKFKNIKRNLANDNEFKNKYFSLAEGKIINDFRIAEVGGNIVLFIYKDKENIFNRCKTYVINDMREIELL